MSVQITQGSGTTVATDTISNVNYQQIKLIDGTVGSTLGIPGDSTNGLFVQVKSTILPTGASTEATLSTINGKITAVNTGAVVLAAGTAYAAKVRLTDGITDNTVFNLTNSKPIATALVDASGNQITSFGGGIQYAEGATQATATGTLTLGKNGTTLKALLVDGSSNLLVNLNTALPTGSNTIGAISNTSFAATQSGSWNITNITGSVTLPTGASTAAKQPALGTAGSASADVITVQGIASMTALKVDGSAVTQPISATSLPLPTGAAQDATLIGGTAKSIIRGGQKGTTNTNADITHTASGSNHEALDVIIYDNAGNFKDPTQIRALTSSDQITIANTSITVTQTTGTNLHTVLDSGTLTSITNTVTTKETRSSTATTSQVAGSATSVQLLASNANRLGAGFVNDSTAILYLKLGTTASSTDYSVKMFQDDYYEIPYGYTGRIDGIWASSTGSARITELT